jgi:hypothetical protein
MRSQNRKSAVAEPHILIMGGQLLNRTSQVACVLLSAWFGQLTSGQLRPGISQLHTWHRSPMM